MLRGILLQWNSY